MHSYGGDIKKSPFSFMLEIYEGFCGKRPSPPPPLNGGSIREAASLPLQLDIISRPPALYTFQGAPLLSLSKE
jgi:hypothetical protein